jgi:hypothetical protein
LDAHQIIKETTSRPDEFLESALCLSIDDVVCCVLLVDTLERTRPDATSSGFARAKSFALFPSERFTAYTRSSVLLDLFAFPPRAELGDGTIGSLGVVCFSNGN